MTLRIILSCSFALSLLACSSAQKGPSAPVANGGKSAAAAKAKKESPAVSQGLDETVCKSGAEERTIAVVSSGSGCKVNYTKGGDAKTVAQAKADMGYCKTVAEKIKAHLTGSGYTCE